MKPGKPSNLNKIGSRNGIALMLLLGAALVLPGLAEAREARTASGRSFDDLDVNRDQRVDRREASSDAELENQYVDVDRNGDGSISREEFSAVFLPLPEDSGEPKESWFTAPAHKPE